MLDQEERALLGSSMEALNERRASVSVEADEMSLKNVKVIERRI